MLLGICFLAAFLSSTEASAQDETPSPTPTPDEQRAPTGTDLQKDQDRPPMPEEAPATDHESFDRTPVNLATGQLLNTTRSPLHWGHLSLLSFDLMQVYDSNYLFLKDNPLSAQAGAAQALLVYAIKTRRTNLSFQYRPQLWVSSDTTVVDYASHSLDLHASRQTSPKWAINFSDQYQWREDSGRIDSIGFTPDYSSSNIHQSPFLAAGQRLISNTAEVTIDNNLTAHSSFEILARHQYIQLSQSDITSPPPGTPAAPDSTQQIYGGQIGWNYQWSRNNSFGFHYGYDRQDFQATDSTVQFHSALLGLSRRLGRTVVVQISGGPSLMQVPVPPGSAQVEKNQLTYQASAVLFKTFRRAGVTLSYSRNDSFTGQITDRLNDRVDASITKRFVRRTDLVVGGSYIRENFSSGAHRYGKSGWAQVNYRLGSSWSLYGTYSYLTQNGGAVAFGPRHLVTSGIRWSWNAGRSGQF
jgi:hypothetical protein